MTGDRTGLILAGTLLFTVLAAFLSGNIYVWHLKRKLGKLVVRVWLFKELDGFIHTQFDLDRWPNGNPAIHVIYRDGEDNHFMPNTLPMVAYKGTGFTGLWPTVQMDRKMKVLFVLIRGDAAAFIRQYPMHPDGYHFIGKKLPGHIHVLGATREMYINEPLESEVDMPPE